MNTSIDNRDYVGLMTCFYCNKEHTGIIMSTRFHPDGTPVNTFPHEAVYNLEPCDQCKAYMQQGIILIGATPESLNQIESDYDDYKRQVDHLPHSRQRHVMPFVPNPYRTGEWIVVTENLIRNLFTSKELADQCIKRRWTFVEQDVAKRVLDIQEKLKNAPEGSVLVLGEEEPTETDDNDNPDEPASTEEG